MSTDSIIMQEVVRGFSSHASLTGLVCEFFSKIPRLIMHVIAKKCIENSSSFLEPIQNFFRGLLYTLVYRQKVYKTNDLLKEDYHLGMAYKTTPLLAHSPVPVSFEESKDSVTVYHIPFLHKQLLAKIEEEGKLAFARHTQARAKRTVTYETFKLEGAAPKSKTCTASNLYASSNYRNLEEMLTAHFEISTQVGANNVLGVLLDGIPGLGKTKFADYAVMRKLAAVVLKIDMTNFLSLPLDSVLSTIYHGRNVIENTIFVVDELDKYVDYRLRTEYEEMQQVEGVENKSFVEFVAYRKLSYLYSMLRVLERDDIQAPVVVLFCSNNFASIFEGIDVTHHRSLYDRFMPVKFHPCRYDELIDYLAYYNEKLKTTKYHEQITKEKIKERLRADISITFRALHHLSIEAMYSTGKLIDLLNSYQPKELPVIAECIQRGDVIASPKHTTPTKFLLSGCEEVWEEEFASPAAENAEFEDGEFVQVQASLLEQLTELTNIKEGERLVEMRELCAEIANDAALTTVLAKSKESKNLFLKYLEEGLSNEAFDGCDEKTCRFIFALTGQNVSTAPCQNKEILMQMEKKAKDKEAWDKLTVATPNDREKALFEYKEKAFQNTPDKEKIKESVQIIKVFLENCSVLEGGEKAKCMKDLYEYLASDLTAQYLLFTQKSTLDVVVQKLEQILTCKPEALLLANQNTKRFVFALTGKVVE